MRTPSVEWLNGVRLHPLLLKNGRETLEEILARHPGSVREWTSVANGWAFHFREEYYPVSNGEREGVYLLTVQRDPVKRMLGAYAAPSRKALRELMKTDADAWSGYDSRKQAFVSPDPLRMAAGEAYAQSLSAPSHSLVRIHSHSQRF